MDDRRVISSILHMLRSEARWRDCPAAYGPYTTIYNRFNRLSRQGIWQEMFAALTGEAGLITTVAIDSTAVKAHRSAAGEKGGAFRQAIGRSRVLMPTPGNIADITAAPALLVAAGPFRRLIANKGYDANSQRRALKDRNAEAVIPPTANRKPAIANDVVAYRQRNLIERMFGRLTDFRRIATRYDKLVRNFLAATALAAIDIWWLN